MNDFKRIKALVKISDVMNGEGYDVEKTGKTQFMTHCVNPFHDDNTPSLGMCDKKGVFKCFSCGIGGDIFNLLGYIRPDLKGKRLLNYVESKYISGSQEEIISSLGGQEIENFQDEKWYREMMQYIALYWSQNVPKSILDTYLISTENITYKGFKGEIKTMQGYGLSKEIVDEYLIGYSPNNSELYKLLCQKYDKELVDKTQLFDSRGLPKFRNRLVIPYFKDNDVVYFTARQTEFTPKNKYDTAKYISQSIDNKYLYNEDDIYNYCVFICEGPFDCLALKNIGYNAIALGGIEGSRRLGSHYQDLESCYLVYICFDNDGGRQGAGNVQAQRLDEVLRAQNISSHQVFLPLCGREKIDISEYLGMKTKEDLCGLLSF